MNYVDTKESDQNCAKEPIFKLAEADEGQGVDGAQQLSVHEVLEGASTGATQPFAALSRISR